MTFADQFRGPFIQAFIDAGMLVPATITTITKVFDPKTGKNVETTSTKSAHAAVETVTVKADSGVLTHQTKITITKAIKVGDKVRVGSTEYLIKSVAITDPDGRGGIIWEGLV